MSPRTPCPAPRDLERLVLGNMPDVEMDVLDRHVSTCRHCLEQIRQLNPRDALVEAVGRAGSVLPLEVDEKLIGRLIRLSSFQDTSETRETVVPLGAGRSARPDLAGLLAPAAEADELGRIGTYGILGILGSGGAGIVFTARDTRLRREVALKMIASGPVVGTSRLHRFRTEIEVLAKLRHPNIVRVYEVGDHAGRPFFTMDLAEGGNLAQRLAVAALPAAEAAALVRTLALAIQAAHAQQIIHRDLKPSNVLLVADGTPLIGDFGLAKQLEESGPTDPSLKTETGAILGTPGYLAPEQIGGRSQEIGPAADIYALGAILYECLTGRPPFKAATVHATLEQARTQEPVSPERLQPGLPRDLRTICLKCLEKDPRRRYPSAQALADDLDRFLAGRPIVARPVRAWERAWKWARRKPSAAALVTVSVLAGVALAGGLAVHQSRLQRALDRAEANATESNRQRERAREHYRHARDTLDQILAQFDRHRLGEVPQLKELQRRQLEKALAFYLAALEDQDDQDTETRRDSAVACRRAADIQQTLGHVDAAGENYRRVIDLLETIPEADRTVADRLLLAGTWNNLGLSGYPSKELAGVIEGHQKARAIFEDLARSDSANVDVRAGLAQTEHYLGALSCVTSDTAAAEKHFRQAATWYADLIRDCPDHAAFRIQQAENQVDLAIVYQTSKREPLALAAYGEAEQAMRRVVDRHPEAGEYKVSLAGVYHNRGIMLKESGRVKEGLADLTRAIDLLDSILRQEPNHAVARHLAANSFGGRAQVHESFQHWAEAVKDWDRMLELDNDPARWVCCVWRAAALARAGDHVRAAAEVEAIDPLPGLNDDGRYNQAAILAIAAGAALKDERLALVFRIPLALRYAGWAVDRLRLLRDGGYFKNPAAAMLLVTDSDLRSLRGRADFKKLMNDLTPKK